MPSSLPLREGTELPKTKVAFVLNAGGIGDYIHYVRAIECAIERYPHLHGYIVSPSFFVDLARLFFSDLRDRFKVKQSDDFNGEPFLKNVPCYVPDRKQFANALGFHPTHLGFIYYMQQNEIPEGRDSLPVINGDEADVSRFSLPADYAVITPFSTDAPRRMTAEAVNKLTLFLRGQGTTPVFLGKAATAAGHESSVSEGVDTEGVIDLTEKTSLREAAVIMAHARFTLGIDNGLLHLATCSTAPVVFCFTNVSPKLRVGKRREGAKTVIVAPPKELKCRFCATNLKFIKGHNFENCLYKDNACASLITGDFLIQTLKDSKCV